MVYKAKYDKSSIAIFMILPSVMVLVVRWNALFSMESLIVLCICYLISFCLTAMIVSVKYILTDEALIICRLGVKKNIPYNRFDDIEEKCGKPTMEAPSTEQLWLMKDSKCLIAVSPKEMLEFEEQLRCIQSRKRN